MTMNGSMSPKNSVSLKSFPAMTLMNKIPPLPRTCFEAAVSIDERRFPTLSTSKKAEVSFNGYCFSFLCSIIVVILTKLLGVGVACLVSNSGPSLPSTTFFGVYSIFNRSGVSSSEGMSSSSSSLSRNLFM